MYQSRKARNKFKKTSSHKISFSSKAATGSQQIKRIKSTEVVEKHLKSIKSAVIATNYK